jgi:hypothetical protein
MIGSREISCSHLGKGQTKGGWCWACFAQFRQKVEWPHCRATRMASEPKRFLQMSQDRLGRSTYFRLGCFGCFALKYLFASFSALVLAIPPVDIRAVCLVRILLGTHMGNNCLVRILAVNCAVAAVCWVII